LFHDKKHPKEMAAAKVEAFLTYPAVDGLVSGHRFSAQPATMDFQKLNI
jgi:hypothetical protein